MKYDVDKYLEGRKLSRNNLHKEIQPMLAVYDKIMELHKKREDTGEHLAQADKVGKDLIAEIKKKHPETKKAKTEAPKTKRETQKTESPKEKKAKETIEKTKGVVDDLSACKRLIKQERKKRIERGELKAPVKQTRYTKIKNSLVRILKSIPGQKESTITTTKEALTESAKKIFRVHGWKQWRLIDFMLEEIAEKRIAKIEKAKE